MLKKLACAIFLSGLLIASFGAFAVHPYPGERNLGTPTIHVHFTDSENSLLE